MILFINKKILIIALSYIFLNACVSTSNFEHVRNNDKIIRQAGISFLPPSDNLWYTQDNNAYETTLIAVNKESQETLVVFVSIFNAPKLEHGVSFLSFIQQNENKKTKSTRFKIVKQSFTPHNHKNAVCVNKYSLGKDYGAKRNKKYKVFEIYGIYCIHPYKKEFAFYIELSRKAPFVYKNKSFKKWGKELLKSIVFKPFKTQ